MLYSIKLDKLYQSATSKAVNSPHMGKTLAGNCTTISYEMLDEARELFGADVRLVVGWIKMCGERYFYFSEQTLKSWIDGQRGETNNVHCWLAKGSEIIDLTLTSTILKVFPNKIDEKHTFIDSSIAKKLNIIYHEVIAGDDILFKLNFHRPVLIEKSSYQNNSRLIL